jgi:hypothetical protein
MIEGNKKLTISAEDLVYYTNGGREVYERYMGRLHKGAMKRPWGTDKHPSFTVFPYEDMWLWKDMATEEAGNPITFVQNLFGLSYKEALHKIAYDFNLTDKAVLADKVYTIQKAEPKRYAHITAKIQKFQVRHHQFWNIVGVTEDWCKKFNCFAVKELAIDRVKYPISDKERVFVYYAKDISKVKVYFPDRQGADRFRTNVPFNYLWEFSNLHNCDKLVIHKSMKDLITFAQIFPCNISTQNESIKVFDEDVVSKINSITTEPWIFYGSDNDGVRKCTEVTNTNGWKYINTPKKDLPLVNDAYSYTKKYGLKQLEEFCKQKHLI